MTVVEAHLGGTKLDTCDITGMMCSSVTDLLIEGIAQNTTGAVFLPEVHNTSLSIDFSSYVLHNLVIILKSTCYVLLI